LLFTFSILPGIALKRTDFGGNGGEHKLQFKRKTPGRRINLSLSGVPVISDLH